MVALFIGTRFRVMPPWSESTRSSAIVLLAFFLLPANAQTQHPGITNRAEAISNTGAVTPARALYDPNPEYSEEARKARLQGTWVVGYFEAK